MARDQSYFLFATTQEQVDFLRFPLGALPKAETGALRRSLGLAVADKPDSQDICFVPDGRYADVDREAAAGAAGRAISSHGDGRVLGRHDGIVNFTVGQRRGLGIGGGEPLYVIRIDARRRRVIVGPRAALRRRRVGLSDVSWLGPDHRRSRRPASGLCQGAFDATAGTGGDRPAKSGGWRVEIEGGEDRPCRPARPACSMSGRGLVRRFSAAAASPARPPMVRMDCPKRSWKRCSPDDKACLDRRGGRFARPMRGGSRVDDWRFGELLAPGRRQAIEVDQPAQRQRARGRGGHRHLAATIFGTPWGITGIDLSPAMLAKARERAERHGLRNVEALLEMDVAQDYAGRGIVRCGGGDVCATAVPDPAAVMRECERVCRPGGKVLVLNHFSDGQGVRGFIEKVSAPAAASIGWRPEFPRDTIMVCERLELVEAQSLNPFGIMQLLRFVKKR